jgi:predicted RND superfamily exporter protein
VVGLAYTDDVYQNNDERYLIANQSLSQEEYDILIINFESIKDYRTELNQIASSVDFDIEIIGPNDLSQTKSIEQAKIFFEKHQQLDIKLIKGNSLSYIIQLEKEARKEHFQLIQSLEEKFPEAKLSGLPYLNYEIGRETVDIKTKILPILMGISFILLLFITRNLLTSILLFMFPFSALPISLVLTKLIYGEANLLSNLAPLVNFVVILCLIFHLFYSVMAFKDFQEVVKHKLKPILFMLITTIFGIASLGVSQVPAIRSFSSIATISLILTSLFTLLSFKKLYPLFLKNIDKVRTFELKIPSLPKPLVLACFIIPLITFSYFKNFLTIEIEALYFFPKSHKVVLNTRHIEKDVIGTPILNIQLQNFDLVKNYDKVQEIDQLEGDILALFHTPTTIISDIQSIKNANSIYSGSKSLPDNHLAALTLKSKIPRINGNSNHYQIRILSKAVGTEDYFVYLDKIKELLKAYPHSFSGNYFTLMNSQSEIISTLLKSFFLSLLFISILIGGLFKNFKDILIFLLINLIPPLITLSLFPLLGLTINLATIMTFSISFGLIVDSTVHVLHAQQTQLQKDKAKICVFMPMLISSLVLLVGFCSFLTHSFLPIWQFGASLALTITFGFIYDYLILPNLFKNTYTDYK